MSYHIIYHTISYHISYIISYSIILYIMSYHIIYHIITYHIIYHVISYHTISYHILISHSILLIMSNISGTNLQRKSKYTSAVHYLLSLHEIMWNNVVEPHRPYVHSEYVIILLFHYNNGYVNAPQCYVIRTLVVLLKNG
jgi:hypothetical protein